MFVDAACIFLIFLVSIIVSRPVKESAEMRTDLIQNPAGTALATTVVLLVACAPYIVFMRGTNMIFVFVSIFIMGRVMYQTILDVLRGCGYFGTDRSFMYEKAKRKDRMLYLLYIACLILIFIKKHII